MATHEEVRVLVAEDNYLVREMIRGILTELNYSVVGEAASGAQAVEMAKSLQPNVIVMDIEMPKMDGIRAAQEIQQICPTPIVILTAYETPELVEQASQAGVNAYLIKPPNSREMERAITIAVARFDDMLALRRANAQLQATNDELDAFAHTAAHDLQSPLGLIAGFSEVLQHNRALYSEEKQQEILATITRIAHKMSNIIDELLLLASVRQMNVKLEPLNMAIMISEARQRLTDKIDLSEAKIIVPESWPRVMGYAPWVEEVWVNYLSNGLKYGGRPPVLELGATVQADGMVRFWVKDNGAGLSLAEQEAVFVPFTRLNQIRTQGYGLGLSIVQRIIDRLGGAVGVESAVGAGSFFWFTLPQAADENA